MTLRVALLWVCAATNELPGFDPLVDESVALEPDNETDNASDTSGLWSTTSVASTSSPPRSCGAGSEARGGRCEACPPGSYKRDDGPGACQACPVGAGTEKEGASSVSDCFCNDTSFEQWDANSTAFLRCSPCPANSRGQRSAKSLSGCACQKGYIRVPADGLRALQSCRAPRPCDVHLKLPMLNLTGPSPQELKNGTCGNITFLEHLASCSLACEGDTAPQARSNFIEAIDVSIVCEDGEITQHPALGTWCSRESYVVPPVVFLGTVTLASVVAGCFIERRRHLWATECAKALQQDGAAPPQVALPSRKRSQRFAGGEPTPRM